MKTNYLLLSFTVNMEKMCDYQMKQFLKEVKKRLVQARKDHESGAFDKYSIHIGETEGKMQ